MPVKSHEQLPEIKYDDTKLWRYLDLQGFLSLIHSQTLFFRRADKFRDHLEGSTTRYNFNMRREVYRNSGMTDEQIDMMFPQLSQSMQIMRECTYINCWHRNERETASMWDSYANIGVGIAVKTTSNRLKSALDRNANIIYIVPVAYIDYDSQWMPEGNLLYPYYHKDISYQSEQEVRCVNSTMDLSGPKDERLGIDLKVDLTSLIERIYISPYSAKWFLPVIEDIVRKYKIDAQIVRSSLALDPVF